MAVVPAHRIHSIHGTFGGPSFASVVPAISSAQASSFASLPNISYSRNAPTHFQYSARTTSPSISASASPLTSLFTQRPRRSSVTGPAPYSSRRAPPPPPITSQSSCSLQDPFADAADAQPIIIALPPPRRSARAIASRTSLNSAYHSTSSSPSLTASSYSRAAPSPPPGIQRTVIPVPDRRAAKLVANVLLNRGSGRPMRRRMMSYGEERPYIKSCLSRVVQIEC
ncbi:hypothetical protein NLI96_g169 [Meripilus lineatus]|uniref:Uncharacterized protein n=1 Tax=Meripilus lineatus TaxID=2056292 RepID=A0AAD5VCT0_9APHY|nr:hypothetical protein NLI96_g169 [Physisporinus lineatus]